MDDSRQSAEITRLLGEMKGAAGQAVFARLLPLVYGELHSLSARYLRRERRDHTLQATALVHEAYLKLVDGGTIDWKDRRHFFGVAARIMRRILVDHAREHQAEKRGGGARRLSLAEFDVALPGHDFALLDLDAAMERLAEHDERKARIVELRFFAGCTIKETAEMMDMSEATIEREWAFARAWLYRQLSSLQNR